MPWYHKEHITPFDFQPIDGLHFLIGDLHPEMFAWTHGMKSPHIAFPSGVTCEVLPSGQMSGDIRVHLFGAVDAPLIASRDTAFAQVSAFAREQGHAAYTVDDTGIVLSGHDPLGLGQACHDEDSYDLLVLLTYDNHTRRLIDVDLVYGDEPDDTQDAPLDI